MGPESKVNLAPNPRLQRTRAAVLLQNLRGKSASLVAVRRAPLSRKPLGSPQCRLSHTGCGSCRPHDRSCLELN